jgi:hypothetical protein
MYFPRNWEFGSALSKLRNFVGGGGLNHQTPPFPPWYGTGPCQSLEMGRYLDTYEDGTDTVFQNVGIGNTDAGESLRRTHMTFRTRQKFEIKNIKYIPPKLIKC